MTSYLVKLKYNEYRRPHKQAKEANQPRRQEEIAVEFMAERAGAMMFADCVVQLVGSLR